MDWSEAVRKAAILAKSGVGSTEELAKLFISLKKTGGWDGLTELIYNTAGALNGFDKYGHFGRTLVTLTTCLKYEANKAGSSGCVARFNGPRSNESNSAETSASALIKLLNEEWKKAGGEGESSSGAATGLGKGESAEGTTPAERRRAKAGSEPALGEAASTEAGTEPLLGYLLGQGE